MGEGDNSYSMMGESLSILLTFLETFLTMYLICQCPSWDYSCSDETP